MQQWPCLLLPVLMLVPTLTFGYDVPQLTAPARSQAVNNGQQSYSATSTKISFTQGRLSVQVHNAPLQSVLETIAQRAKFVVVVSPAFAQLPVSVVLTPTDLESGLQEILRQAGVANAVWGYRKKPQTPGENDNWELARLTIVAEGHGSTLLTSPTPAANTPQPETPPVSTNKKLLQEQFRDPKTNQLIDVAAREVMVRFKPKMSATEIEKRIKRLNAEVINAVPQFGLYHLALSEGDTVSSFIDKHQKDPRLQVLEPNPIVTVAPVTPAPNDPLFRAQWALERIGAPQAWRQLPNHAGGVVAVVDSGVDERHPDLQGHIVRGKNLIDGSDDFSDQHGHGTAIAGIIAASTNNAIGMSGICPTCQILPVKVLDESGRGTYANVIAGIMWAAERKVEVINLSLGSYGSSRFLAEAIDYAHHTGAVIVAAGGNESSQAPLYPGALPNVIAVSASDIDDNLWTGSNFGSAIDIAAPGVRVLSLDTHNSYMLATGSSFSAAQVSGVAALVRTKHPMLKNTQVSQVLFQTSDDLGEKGKDQFYGFGRINAARALRAEVR